MDKSINRVTFWILLLSLFWVMATLSACAGSPNRGEDAAAPPPEVPAAPTAESPAAAPTDEAPVAETSPTPATSAPTDQAQVAQGFALVFSVSGGIVGFCDELRIDAGGNYILNICDQEEYSGTLSEPDKVTLQSWLDNLAGFQFVQEDNPGGPDNLSTTLIFNGTGNAEANENQQQVILDWASGLSIRVRPQPEIEQPTPVPVVVGPEGLCPEISRPALMSLNFETPNLLALVDPATQARCDITLQQIPAGRVTSAAGKIFYQAFDEDTQTMVVRQLAADGQETTLAFTEVTMNEPGPYDFVVSSDGTKIAWAYTTIDFESDPLRYRNSLRTANIDGSGQATILDQVENGEMRFVSPVRFASDGRAFFYALQPDTGGPVLSGRFDTLYRLTLSQNQAQLIYACPQDNPACIGGVSPDGELVTIIQPAAGVIQLFNTGGGALNSIALPATDYTERIAFSPSGNLAFVTATLAQASEDSPPLPSPGYLSVITPPYGDQPQTLLSNNNIGTLLGWIDDNRLIYGTLDAEGNTGTAIVSLDGQVMELPADTSTVPVGVLR